MATAKVNLTVGLPNKMIGEFERVGGYERPMSEELLILSGL